MPHLEPRLTVRAIRPLVSGLRALGYDPASILAPVGIDDVTLNDPDAWVPMSAGVGVLTHAVERTGDTNLGLHLAEHAELSSVDVHFYAMLSSSTLGAAYERLWRVHRVHHLDTELDVSTTVRFHPIEFFITLALGVPIVVAFGLGAHVL